MATKDSDKVPTQGEALAAYVRRVRIALGMSQAQTAERAEIHLQSLGKIEAGKTTRLFSKTKAGLSRALQVSEEYLEAVCRGASVETVQQLKICPNCWVPGTKAEPMWLSMRSKYCFACGTLLRDRCVSCNEPIMSLKHRFCPYCGTAYKLTPSIEPT